MQTVRVALVSFLVNSINIRTLASYIKADSYETYCFFCPDSFNESNLAELIRILKEKEIGLIGISLVTDDYQSAVELTSAIKKEINIPVIWGGAHVNVMPEECLLHADMICRGEGEEALLDLVKVLSTQEKIIPDIKNIWFKTENGIVKNELRSLEENLDKYPFPDFDLSSQYVMNAKGFEQLREEHLNGEYSLMSSRGCPYSCNYCYNSYRRKHYHGKGKYLRKRSIENVIQELIQAKQIFKNLSQVNFWDDSFVARKVDEFNLFSDLYAKKIKLPFFALIEPMAFDYEKIKLLKKCGLSKLQVGIQSGSERVNRDVYNRPVSNKKIVEVAHLIKQLGVAAVYDFIFNNPYEKSEDIKQTIELLLKFPRPLYLQGYNLIFYPGTIITEKALADGFITDNSADIFSSIQNPVNSPTAMKTGAVVSNRFYSVNYDSKEKDYLNLVFSLLCFNYIPHWLIGFFIRSESRFHELLIKTIIKSYEKLSQLKRAKLFVEKCA